MATIPGIDGPHPEMRTAMVGAFNEAFSREGRPMRIQSEQVEMVCQRTMLEVLEPAPGLDVRGSISCALVYLREIEPRGATGLMVALATREQPDLDWKVVSFNARSQVFHPTAEAVPGRRISPPVMLVSPALGISCGILIGDDDVATLRITLGDGTTYEDTSHHSLLVFAPLWTGNRVWSDDDAPLLQLISADGADLVTPMRLVMPTNRSR